MDDLLLSNKAQNTRLESKKKNICTGVDGLRHGPVYMMGFLRIKVIDIDFR